MKKFTLLLVALLMTTFSFSQTVLTAGDIAFMGSNTDASGGPSPADNVVFVLLKDVDAATQIIFTDRGWNDATGFSNFAGDGELTWTSGVARTAGDIIVLDLTALSGGGVYSILGDQLFAIQGSIGAPTFIAGIHFNVEGGTDDANWDGAATSNGTSALPNALVNGNTAIRLENGAGAEQDNWQFSCTLAGGPLNDTAANVRAALHDRTDWNSNNTAGFNPVIEAGCTVTVTAGADTTPPVVTCAPTPAPITAGVNGMAPIPDLVTGSSATDDVSAPANIAITQSPTAGTMVGVGVHVVTVTATDEAGNSASCTINVTVNEPPSTSLAAGDIAFVGFNLDGGDGWAFILLKDIIAGTNIKFTDCGVNNPNTINCLAGDSTGVWYSPTAMTAGSIVTLDGSFFSSGPLSNLGDQILAFQGTEAAPIFIAGIHSNVEVGTNDTDWDGAALNNDESALPNQLINGVNAIRLHDTGTEVDNWQFDCSLVPGGSPISGTASNIAMLINDIQYWINSDTAEFVPAAAAGCSYNVVVSGDTTPPVISDCGPTPPDIVADTMGNALVPDLTSGVVATDDVTAVANLVISQSPAAGTTITAGVTVVTLFVTDEAGNTSSCTINVTVVNPPSTTLAAGDIAFVGINLDGNDSFAFILLQNIIAGTNIAFTDCGVTNPNTISCIGSLDDTAIWFAPTAMSAGDIVTLDASFIGSLGSIGDQIFAYQGPESSPTFLAGVHTSVITGTNDLDWDGANTSGATSALPDQLTNGVDAVRLHATETEVDNWQFDCTLVPGGLPISGTPAQIAAIINDLQYWISNDTTEFVPAAASGCSYNVILDSIPPVITCPANATVECGGDTSPANTGTATATDNMDPNPVITFSDSSVAGCGNTETITRTWTATDNAGNSSSCTQTITVVDTTPPSVTVPGDATVECGGDTSPTGTGTATGNDGCGTVNITFSDTSVPGCGNTETITRTWTATDECGNTAQANQIITVVDTTPPTITCPGDITVSNDPGICGAVVTYTAPVGSDTCGTSTTVLIAGLGSGATFPVGTTTETYQVTDDCGNMATCSFDVTVNDTEPPTITCPADITQDNDPGDCGAVVNFAATASENCPGPVTITYSQNPGTQFPVGTTSVTATATDGAGNSSSCTFNVIVNDTENPDITCPSDITVNNDPGVCGATVNYTVTATDNCMVVASNGALSTVSPPNNSSTGTMFDIVAGATDIVINDFDFAFRNNGTTPANVEVWTKTGTYVGSETNQAAWTLLGTQVYPTQSASAPVNYGMGGIVIPAGQTLGVYFATNNGVRIGYVNGSNTFNDANITINAGAGVFYPFVSIVPDRTWVGTVNYSVLGGPTQIAGLPSGAVFPVGTTTNTYEALDAAGNVVTCSFDVTVNDTENPTITCPADIVANNDAGLCSAVVTYTAPTGTDNCPGSTTMQTAGLPSGSVFPVGITTNTFVVTDASGNTATCSFNVIVLDNEDPVAVCLDITVQLDANGMVTVNGIDVDGGSTDNCGIASYEFQTGIVPLSTNPILTLGNGNDGEAIGYNPIDGMMYHASGISSGQQYFEPIDLDALTVGANLAPGNTWPGGLTQEVTGMVYYPPLNGFVAMDRSENVALIDPVTANFSLLSNYVGSYLRGFTVVGTSIYGVDPFSSDLIEFDPNTGAILSTVAVIIDGVEITAGSNGLSTDPTTGITYIIYKGGGPTRSLATIDLSTGIGTGLGNTGSRFAGISFDSAGTLYGISGDGASPAETLYEITIPGPVSVPSLDFTCADVGPNSVTLLVTDLSGNTSTCTATVTVEDNVPPVAVCMDIDVFLDSNGMASIVPSDVDGGSTDACGIASLSIDVSDFDCDDVGPNNVVLTVTDVNGNMSSCTAIVTVIDDIDPVIFCPADTTVNTTPGDCFAEVTFPDAIATDNCAVTVAQTGGLPSGSMFPVGVNTVEFTATDASGNTAVCTFTITVVDNEPAMAVCQDITVDLDPTGTVTILPADVDGGSSDNCGIASMTVTPDTFSCADVGPNNVVLEITDVNGNVSSCTAVVTVQDVTPPVAVCMDITVELDVNGTVTILPTDVGGGSTDACGIADMSVSPDTFTCADVGDNPVVLTVTDNNGNVSTCTATVTVEDNIAPDLVCMDITVELDEFGMAMIVPEDLMANNTDACGIFTTAVDIFEFDCDDIGAPITVTVFSQDNNGNNSVCTALVTVVDLLGPVVTCPADQTVDPGPGNLFYEVPDYFALGEASAVDNCTDPVVITSQDPAPGTLLGDGVYTITCSAEDEYGNIGTCTFELTVESVLGANDVGANISSIILYPNPTTDYVNISNPQNVDLKNLQVFDLTGRLVITENLEGMGAERAIDITMLQSATYMFIIQSDNGQMAKQIVKE